MGHGWTTRHQTEVEIGLHRRDGDFFAIELRVDEPEREVDLWLASQRPVQIDLAALRTHRLDPPAYGRLLSTALFADQPLRDAFLKARAAANDRGEPLRVRLLIGPSASDLHHLHWELLRDPEDLALPLFGDRVYFSRYLGSLDRRPVQARSHGELRSLIAIANPSDLHQYLPGGRALDALPVTQIVETTRAALQPITATVLASDGTATLDALVDTLRDDYDILYLVCHGAIVGGQARLWLEAPDGTAAVVDGSELLDRFRGLRRWPRLVVLVSCQSAGQADDRQSADQGELAAIGPRLVEAGIPAVLAMQGDISYNTIAALLPIFFRELHRHGELDRALAVARQAIVHRPDHWMPVLLMRLKNGRLWYRPGLDSHGRSFEKWPALRLNLSNPLRGLTPILGPGLNEPLWGSTREIAWHWAERFRYPMAPHSREDLPQVTQFLSFSQDYSTFPHESLMDELRQQLWALHRGDLDPTLRTAALDQLVDAVWASQQRRSPDSRNPYAVLARLPVPIYITTTPDRLLARALTAAGRSPHEVIVPWNTFLEEDRPEAIELDGDPTPDRPLVYYLFGRLDAPESMVLTEDDYFRYLVGITRNRELIPSVVRKALTRTLLLIGFQLDSWDFRACIHGLLDNESYTMRKRLPHVAVQVEPDERRFLRPDRARSYLETYFTKNDLNGPRTDIGIFWGGVGDFIRELERELCPPAGALATPAGA